MLANALSILSLAISVPTLLFTRRGYLREKARLEALEARYPHLAHKPVARATER